MNDRQGLALDRILNTAEGIRTPPELTVVRTHRPTGLLVMSTLAVDR